MPEFVPQLLLTLFAMALGTLWLVLHLAHLWSLVDVAARPGHRYDEVEQSRWVWTAVLGLLLFVPFGGLGAIYYLARVRPKLESGSGAQPIGIEDIQRLLAQARERAATTLTPPHDPSQPIPGSTWSTELTVAQPTAPNAEASSPETQTTEKTESGDATGTTESGDTTETPPVVANHPAPSPTTESPTAAPPPSGDSAATTHAGEEGGQASGVEVSTAPAPRRNPWRK